MEAKKKILVIAVLLVIGMAAIVAVRLFSKKDADSGTEAGVVVVAGYAQRSEIEEILRYPGTLIPKGTVTVVPKISGRIAELLVKEGDPVSLGQRLLTIEDDSVRLQMKQALSAWNAALAQYRKAERGVREGELESAKASLGQAEEDLAVAERGFERSKRLLEAGAIARAKFEESENALSTARTELENARRSVQMMEEGASSEELDMAQSNADAMEAQYNLAKLQFDYARVAAPVSGIVARVFVDEGNTVGVGSPLLTLVAEDPIGVSIAVPEKYYGRFLNSERDLSVRVFPVAYPDQDPFVGAVSAVAHVIDTTSRTFVVEATIENRQRLLRPGMYVNAEIITGSREDVMVVPRTAIVLRNDNTVVFRIDEGNSHHVSMVTVKTGMTSNNMIEIIGMISTSDILVLRGNSFLEDGQQVRLVEDL